MVAVFAGSGGGKPWSGGQVCPGASFQNVCSDGHTPLFSYRLPPGLSHRAELLRLSVLQKSEIFTVWPFTEKLC